MSLASLKSFNAWFTSQGGSLDESFISYAEFEEGGRGVIALKDIPENTTLFRLPRSLTLSTRTSSLPALIKNEWEKFGLGKGWVGLILCMLWEEDREGGKWNGYFESLPRNFETPMFWSREEIEWLKGTAVYDKIGREDAERDHAEKIVPVVKSRPDIFDANKLETQYSLENYHRMGSLILSRSFQVEEYEGEEEEEGNSFEAEHEAEPAPQGNEMEVDKDCEPSNGDKLEEKVLEGEAAQSDDESDDGENSEDVAMVPLADILNARYGSANAKLFYEEKDLGMIAIRNIKSGEQIWNTYGDLPNSDLLRRYGHIDLLPLEDGTLGNPADIVEVRADLVVKSSGLSEKDALERVDRWLEEGDDVFVFDRSFKTPDPIISFIKLLKLTDNDWNTTCVKGKLPKPRMDDVVAEILQKTIKERLREYPTLLEEDELAFQQGKPITSREKAALHVRFAEKRILMGVLQTLELEKSKKSNGVSKRRHAEHARKDASTKRRKY